MVTQTLDIKDLIEVSVKEGEAAVAFLRRAECLDFIQEVGHLLAKTFESGHKLLVCGNGGSLCDAMHFAEELTGQFRAPRRALPAIALGDAGHMSCIANDLGFDHVFSRGVEALGQKGDVLVLLTTSGRSPNLIEAARMAKAKGMIVVAFLGKSGGALKGMGDYELHVKGFETSDRIQEAHMTAIHIIIQVIESVLFT